MKQTVSWELELIIRTCFAKGKGVDLTPTSKLTCNQPIDGRYSKMVYVGLTTKEVDFIKRKLMYSKATVKCN